MTKSTHNTLTCSKVDAKVNGKSNVRHSPRHSLRVKWAFYIYQMETQSPFCYVFTSNIFDVVDDLMTSDSQNSLAINYVNDISS